MMPRHDWTSLLMMLVQEPRATLEPPVPSVDFVVPCSYSLGGTFEVPFANLALSHSLGGCRTYGAGKESAMPATIHQSRA
jgi:hypothetical protein